MSTAAQGEVTSLWLFLWDSGPGSYTQNREFKRGIYPKSNIMEVFSHDYQGLL